MRGPARPIAWLAGLIVTTLCTQLIAAMPQADRGATGATPRPESVRSDALPAPLTEMVEPPRSATMTIPIPPTILTDQARPIDLNSALQLAGVQNPELNLARQRVVEAAALRQLAAAQFLPSINLGVNYDGHTGVLQQSSGNILSVNRSSLYVGAGANAIAAGTVNIPGIVLSGNVATVVYGYLISKQVVAQRQFATVAIRNQTFLQVALAYSELTRAEGLRAVSLQSRAEAGEVARLTAEYAATGEGRKADADRAATELARREALVLEAEAQILVASAELCRITNLDPSIRLYPTDAYVVPLPIVPDPQPLSELIAIGMLHRPELGERRAVIRESLLALEGAKVLPFSPTILIGLSAGGFGGGSNLVRPVFGGFGGRTDLDSVAYWTLQNLGVGNLALIRIADARLRASHYQQIAVLNRVRAEVAEAYARTHARFAQIGVYESAVRASRDGFREDFALIRERGVRTVLPIELLNNYRLLADSRRYYLDSIVDYNRAQFELYVALGQPPADVLAHVVPVSGVAPSGIPSRPNQGGPAGLPPVAVPPISAANGGTVRPEQQLGR